MARRSGGLLAGLLGGLAQGAANFATQWRGGQDEQYRRTLAAHAQAKDDERYASQETQRSRGQLAGLLAPYAERNPGAAPGIIAAQTDILTRGATLGAEARPETGPAFSTSPGTPGSGPVPVKPRQYSLASLLEGHPSVTEIAERRRMDERVYGAGEAGLIAAQERSTDPGRYGPARQEYARGGNPYAPIPDPRSSVPTIDTPSQPSLYEQARTGDVTLDDRNAQQALELEGKRGETRLAVAKLAAERAAEQAGFRSQDKNRDLYIKFFMADVERHGDYRQAAANAAAAVGSGQVVAPSAGQAAPFPDFGSALQGFGGPVATRTTGSLARMIAQTEQGNRGLDLRAQGLDQQDDHFNRRQNWTEKYQGRRLGQIDRGLGQTDRMIGQGDQRLQISREATAYRMLPGEAVNQDMMLGNYKNAQEALVKIKLAKTAALGAGDTEQVTALEEAEHGFLQDAEYWEAQIRTNTRRGAGEDGVTVKPKPKPSPKPAAKKGDLFGFFEDTLAPNTPAISGRDPLRTTLPGATAGGVQLDQKRAQARTETLATIDRTEKRLKRKLTGAERNIISRASRKKLGL